jgi:hypothetical protein
MGGQQKGQIDSQGVSMAIENQDGYDSPAKCFDLSQARAMFMPHKVPMKNGLASADS